MRYEDCDSKMSVWTSKTIEYVESKNSSGIASLIMTAVWIIASLSVLIGYSPTNAIIAMIVSYLAFRVVELTDSSTEREVRTGVYPDIKRHNPTNEHRCASCQSIESDGELVVAYKTLYLLGYEIGRVEKTENLTCDDCSLEEDKSSDREEYVEKELAG